MRENKAFSLVEILIVIGLVGLILTVVVFILNIRQSEMRNTKRISDMQGIRSALEVIKNENGSYEKAFCDLGIVSACGTKSASELLKIIPELSALDDPAEKQTACAAKDVCSTKNCNYAITKLEPDDYEILFHLERGINEFQGAGCYRLSPRGIERY
ncbi:type II secretion system protein [Candidatus Falkowbacteria bacterium]|nr:type II secretion system protein [Candidatus Falkowbacteria bacterium]